MKVVGVAVRFFRAALFRFDAFSCLLFPDGWKFEQHRVHVHIATIVQLRQKADIHGCRPASAVPVSAY
jgi:hypothetical protein